MSIEAFVQIMIAVFGVTAVSFIFSGDARLRRIAPWIGLCGQPFWIAFAWGKYGAMLVTLLYTAVYLYALYRLYFTDHINEFAAFDREFNKDIPGVFNYSHDGVRFACSLTQRRYRYWRTISGLPC